MTRMQQRILLLTVAALLVAACGSGTGTSEESTTTTSSVETTTTQQPPATTTTLAATSTTEAQAAGYVSGADADADAIANAYDVAFDSSTSFEDKSLYIEDPEGLEETVATYAATGDSVGGVSVSIQSITVNGSEADVVYTLQFSGNPTYPGQTGTAIMTDNGWVLSRQMFCGVMASARSACPSG